MKSLVLWLSLLLTLTGSAQPLTVPLLEVKRTEQGAVLKVKGTGRDDLQGRVSLPVEGVLLNSPGLRSLKEWDLAGSGLQLDLDGDGATTSELPLTKKDGQPYLDSHKVVPLSDGDLSRQHTGGVEPFQWNEQGAGLILYTARPRTILGADHHGVKAGFESHPNPFLQVLLLEPCDEPAGEPLVRLESCDEYSYAWEPGVFSAGPSWMRVQSVALEIERAHTLKITGKGRVLIVARVNYSQEYGIRLRGTPEVRQLDLKESP